MSDRELRDTTQAVVSFSRQILMDHLCALQILAQHDRTEEYQEHIGTASTHANKIGAGT